MKFEDYGGLTIPRHIAPAALKFSHAPPTRFHQAGAAPAARTWQGAFAERPFLNRYRIPAAPVHRALRFDDRPGPNLRKFAAAPIIRTSMRFEERPGLSLRPLAAAPLEPLRFTDYCVPAANCGPFDVALHRALQLPEQDSGLIASRLDSMIARGHLASALPLRETGPVVAANETCRTLLMSKLDYFACLGLPSGTLKKEIGSPMFKRVGLIPRGGGRYQLGTPYRIGGHLFQPREIPDYDEIGIASWYGHRFHRRMTANGEWFDMEYFTAAHPTMPLPSYARVINLENGKEMVVRVNDRGPFVGSRLIDLSKKTAEMLEFRAQGVAKVRVQYIGPAPLDDNGRHLAAMNLELRRGTPLTDIIAVASGLRQQHAMMESAPANAGLPAQAF